MSPIVLDPPVVATDYESIVLGTDMGVPLELNSATGPLVLDSIAWGVPKKKPRWVEGGSDGAVLVDDEMAYDNAEVTAAVRVEQQASFDTTRLHHGQLVEMLQEADRRGDIGLPCSYTPVGGTTTWTWYLLLGEADELPVTHESGYFARSPVLTVRMTRKPALYAPWVTGPTVTSSLPLVTLSIPSIPGDLPADGKLAIFDMASQARRFVEWGLEQRYAAEQKAANGGVDPPLLIDSDDLVTSGFSGTGTTRAGAYDPNASGNSVIRSTLTTVPTAVCGTGDLKHIGTFRVRGRVWASSASVRVRLAYQDGDGPFRANNYATPAVVGAFARVDLGLITVEQASSGTQRWSGRVEAYGAAGDTIDVDELELVPAGEGYGKARAAYSYTAGVLSGYDDFTSLTAGTALNGRVAPSGGTWATSGVATDFAGKATTGTSVTRSTISEASPRFAILGSTNFTDVEVSATVGGDSAPQVAIEWRVIARWVDANNYLALLITTGGPPTVSLVKVVAGVVTTLASLPSFISIPDDSAMRARLVVFASGVVIAHVEGSITADLVASDSALATGGTLATGKPGFADRYSGTTSLTVREYDNFSVAIPAAEPIVIYSGQSLEIRTDATKRLNSAGTIEGPAPSYFGSRFKVPPAGAAGRVSRIAVSTRRGDVETVDDAGVTDSTRVQASYRAKYLVPR